MKKTIVIIILAVYVASIAAVNFFGLETKVFDGTTYVESIECNSITARGNGDAEIAPQPTLIGGARYFVFDFLESSPDNPYTTDAESILSNPNAIVINYEVLPHLADDRSVKFIYDESADYVVFHELSRSFIFLKPNKMLTVTIKANDGSNVSTTIKIMGRVSKT